MRIVPPVWIIPEIPDAPLLSPLESDSKMFPFFVVSIVCSSLTVSSSLLFTILCTTVVTLISEHEKTLKEKNKALQQPTVFGSTVHQGQHKTRDKVSTFCAHILPSQGSTWSDSQLDFFLVGKRQRLEAGNSIRPDGDLRKNGCEWRMH